MDNAAADPLPLTECKARLLKLNNISFVVLHGEGTKRLVSLRTRLRPMYPPRGAVTVNMSFVALAKNGRRRSLRSYFIFTSRIQHR